MPTWWCLHELDVCTGLPKKASGNHESHALTPLYCSINTNPFFIFNSLKSHQSCNSRANSSLKNCKRLIAYSNSHNDARYNLSFCSADTKFQYIIIIWEMIWPCEALMLHFDDKCRHMHCVISTCNRHAPFWSQEGRFRKSNSQTKKFCLKIGVYFKNTAKYKSLLNILL